MAIEGEAPPTDKVLIFCHDLMLRVRVDALVREAGFEPTYSSSMEGEGLETALAAGDIRAAVVDLQPPKGDPIEIVRRLRAVAQPVPVIAFGRHTEPKLLASARSEGAVSAIPRSQMVTELPDLLRSSVTLES